jgi:hypothetical protein
VIDVRDCRAYVSQWTRQASGFRLQPASNWEALEDAAADEVSAVGGYITMSGIYPCSTVLAGQAVWPDEPSVA